MIPTTLILIQLIGWISAYPRYKKWTMESKITWTNGDCIFGIFICFFIWPFAWIGFLVNALLDATIFNPQGWWNRKSKF